MPFELQIRTAAQIEADALATAKTAARARLAVAIAAARAPLVTDLPGQQMIYLAKEAEARAWLTASAPALVDHPLLAAEVGITAPDAHSLAQLWLNMGNLWRGTAAQLEALRLSTAAAIDTAPDLQAVNAAVTTLETTLNGV